MFLVNVYGQEKAVDNRCAESSDQTWVVHKFRQERETIEIPIRGDGLPASARDCKPVALELRWANGRNNGSNFTVTLLDDNNGPVFSRTISAFLTGTTQIALSSFEPQPVYGSSLALFSVPTKVTIQAAPPFAPPVNLSYAVTRVARAAERQEAGAGRSRKLDEPGNVQGIQGGQGNEIVSIHHAVRLIGASRLPLVQIELKTSRPFPVREVPLQLQIGKKVFIEELSGDYTGRKLTLSLTPEMFAELTDGDEIVAFFSKPSAEGDVWSFGRLGKKE
jgi:hypothetical protein